MGITSYQKLTCNTISSIISCMVVACMICILLVCHLRVSASNIELKASSQVHIASYTNKYINTKISGIISLNKWQRVGKGFFSLSVGQSWDIWMRYNSTGRNENTSLKPFIKEWYISQTWPTLGFDWRPCSVLQYQLHHGRAVNI